jgi:hypothetical protein
MLSVQPELVWEGRVHLGDEPGVYGDAAYSGIALECPLTLRKTDPAGPDTTTLVLHTQDVQTFTGYPGHLITVTAYQPDPQDPTHSIETPLTTATSAVQTTTTRRCPSTSPVWPPPCSSASESAWTPRYRRVYTTTS